MYKKLPIHLLIMILAFGRESFTGLNAERSGVTFTEKISVQIMNATIKLKKTDSKVKEINNTEQSISTDLKNNYKFTETPSIIENQLKDNMLNVKSSILVNKVNQKSPQTESSSSDSFSITMPSISEFDKKISLDIKKNADENVNTFTVHSSRSTPLHTTISQPSYYSVHQGSRTNTSHTAYEDNGNFNDTEWNDITDDEIPGDVDEMFDDPCAYLSYRINNILDINISKVETKKFVVDLGLSDFSDDKLPALNRTLYSCVESFNDPTKITPKACIDIKLATRNACKLNKTCDEDEAINRIVSHIKHIIMTDSIHDALLMMRVCAEQIYQAENEIRTVKG